MPQLSYFYALFVSHILGALPFLLFGIVISSGLLVFVDEHQLVEKLPRSRILAVMIGSSIGIVIPVGQYGNIPLVRRLLLQGVSVPVCISFLIASPTINPFVIWNSWQVLGNHPRLLFLRIFGAWIIGVMVGLVFSTYSEKSMAVDAERTTLKSRSTLVRSGTLLTPLGTSQPLHRAGNLIYEYQGTSVKSRPLKQQILAFVDNLVREFLELGSILVLGAAIAAVIQGFLPQSLLLAWGQTPLTQLIVLLILSVVISVNSLWSPYFLSSFSSMLLSGSSFVFLLLGSLFNLPSLVLLLGTLKPKAALYLIILTTQLILVFGLVLNFYFN